MEDLQGILLVRCPHKGSSLSGNLVDRCHQDLHAGFMRVPVAK